MVDKNSVVDESSGIVNFTVVDKKSVIDECSVVDHFSWVDQSSCNLSLYQADRDHKPKSYVSGYCVAKGRSYYVA